MLVELARLPGATSSSGRRFRISFMCNGKRRFLLGNGGQVWEGDYAILMVVKEITTGAFEMENV